MFYNSVISCVAVIFPLGEIMMLHQDTGKSGGTVQRDGKDSRNARINGPLSFHLPVNSVVLLFLS